MGRLFAARVVIAVVIAFCALASWSGGGVAFADVPELLAAPWLDGEAAVYDSVAENGIALGATELDWSMREGVWVLREGKNEVVLRDDLWTDRSTHTSKSSVIEARYSNRSVDVTVTPTGAAQQTKSIALDGPALDNDYVLEALRAAPLAPGFEHTFTTVVPSSGKAPLTIRVGRTEKVTVPAGSFDAFRVELDYGPVSHFAWYTVDSAHWLVRYENTATHGALVLRRFVRRAGEAPVGDATSPTLPTRDHAPPANWVVVAVACLVQYPLMIVFPWLLAWRIKKRTGLLWGVWGWGALTFIMSQVVHIPLNWAIGLLGATRGLSLAPYPIYVAAVGLSAGLCEELARYGVIRLVTRIPRDDRASLLFGAGHGGVESLIFGLLAFTGFANMFLLAYLPPSLLGLTPETAHDVNGAALAYWNTKPVGFALAGFERLSAIAFHVMATHFVMRAVARRRLGWLVLAIVAHALLDGAAVVCTKKLGAVPTSVIFAGLGIVCVVATYLVRRSPASKTAG